MPELQQTPDYAAIVSGVITAAEKVSADALTSAQVAKHQHKFTGLCQQSAFTCLLQQAKKREQLASDKILLQETIAQWIADGSPTSRIVNRDGVMGLGV